MKSTGLIICLILLSSGLFAQDTLDSRRLRLILKDLAELDMRRKNAVVDSLFSAKILQAYHFKDSALVASQKATVEAERIGSDYKGLLGEKEKELTQANKEVKKQRLLKFLFLGLGVVGVVLSQ